MFPFSLFATIRLFLTFSKKVSPKVNKEEYVVTIRQLLKNPKLQMGKKDIEGTLEWLKKDRTEALYKKTIEKMNLLIPKDVEDAEVVEVSLDNMMEEVK